MRIVNVSHLGCNRTVQQWQHVWSVWVAKVKTKARKINDSIRATGGGPTISELTDIEQKIIDVVGIASIQGFASLEVGITPSFARVSPPAPVLLPSVQSPQEPQEEQEQPQPISVQRKETIKNEYA
ncbi:unnamed protein product [Arctia plantaginis]|uniref:Uncharacterized protein n=1 Tax=Arctia plantaginis TaxID=874455 RepID=A0A8S0YM46_ARCPL|nr:unnamed protein product [Arctia plantaginis]